MSVKKHQATLFYLGTLVSSVGSMTFNVALVAFMIRSGYSLFESSVIIGLQRLVPILLSFLLGDWTDRLAPRTVVLLTELGAAVGTMGILWSWSMGKPGYLLLVAFCLIKSAGLAFQTGSRALITKLLSTESYASHSRHAIWLNNATQGATLFGGIFGFFAVKYLTLAWVIWFDFSTFVINGIAIALLSVGTAAATIHTAQQGSLFQKFVNLYRHNPRAAVLDALLALVMMGNMSFRARVAGDHQEWIAIFMLSYGIAVWSAGFLERSNTFKNFSSSLWLLLGGAYAALGFLPDAGWLSFGLFLVRDTCYWLLLHRLSAYIQADTPKAIFGSVTAARNTLMVAIIAGDELVVGAWQGVLPLVGEGLWRTVVCVGIAFWVALRQVEPRLEGLECYERPRI